MCLWCRGISYFDDIPLEVCVTICIQASVDVCTDSGRHVWICVFLCVIKLDPSYSATWCSLLFGVHVIMHVCCSLCVCVCLKPCKRAMCSFYPEGGPHVHPAYSTGGDGVGGLFMWLSQLVEKVNLSSLLRTDRDYWNHRMTLIDTFFPGVSLLGDNIHPQGAIGDR